MATARRKDIRWVAGRAGTLGLAGAAALHGLWASGSSWPARDRDDLADLLVGQTPFPSTAATAGTAGLLGVAAALAAGSSGSIPIHGRRSRSIARAGSSVVASALLVRGAAGLVLSTTGTGGASERFRRWDLRIYSPLCIGLGGAVALGSVAR